MLWHYVAAVLGEALAAYANKSSEIRSWNVCVDDGRFDGHGELCMVRWNARMRVADDVQT